MGILKPRGRLCALCAALFSVKMHLSAVAVMKEDLPFVLAQLPDIRIADGRLSTEIPALQPAVKDPLYAVRSPGGELLAVIDETADSAPEGLGGARSLAPEPDRSHAREAAEFGDQMGLVEEADLGSEVE